MRALTVSRLFCWIMPPSGGPKDEATAPQRLAMHLRAHTMLLRALTGNPDYKGGTPYKQLMNDCQGQVDGQAD